MLLNAKYLVVFQNLRDKNHFTYFARQVYPTDNDDQYRSSLDEVRRPLDPA